MPTYEYKCNACGHRFEQFQSMKDKPLKKCPECEKNALERLIGTGAAVLFKGSGFYQTDYRSEGYKKAAAAEKPSGDAKPDSAKSETSKPAASNGSSKPAETKPAAKSESKKKSE